MAADGTTPWYRRWWALLLVVPAGLAVVAGILLFFVLFATIPLPEDIGIGATRVLDAAGDEVGTLTGQVARQDVELDRLPPHVPQAVMAAEDRRFYEHGGISATGILRALFTNVRAGGIEQGGSTITQQYVKNALVGADRTFLRKAREAALAVKMERRFTKDEILELYLNSIYWGRGAYGIEAAAQTYFGIPAADLDPNQAATLAGIIRAPENLDPLDVPERADTRRRSVLAGMLEEGWLDGTEHDRLLAAGPPEVSGRTSVASGPHAYYLDAVRRELATVLGSEEEVFRGLTVRTTLDTRLQDLAQRSVAEAVEGAPYTGALVSVEPSSGAVRALVGGPDFTRQQFNYAIRGPRQVGSAFKPFTLAAFLGEGLSPRSRFPAPATIEVEDTEGTTTVSNYDGRGRGTQDLYAATATSTNTVYVQVQQEAGDETVIATATDVGLPGERDGEPIMEKGVATLTLGVDEFTALDMASAYGTFAAGGVHATPHLIRRVEGPDGEMLHETELEQTAVMRANDAHVVTDVLRGVVTAGTGTAADIGRPVAGKTGTTQENVNAWFVGYTPQLATAVWIGSPDNQPMEEGVSGGGVPASTWAAFMGPAMEPLQVRDFPAPDLSGYDDLNPAPEPCPEGYARRGPATTTAPPADAGTASPRPVEYETAPGTADDDGVPCTSPRPVEPSPSPSPSPSATGPLTPLPSPTTSVLPTAPTSPSPEPSPSPDPTSTPTPSPSPSPTGGPSPRPSETATATSGG